ncbi:MAG: peptidase family protein [Thermoleophilia bacterium]|nr:peptidase family protein [Thermoleophilia bacterium]
MQIMPMGGLGAVPVNTPTPAPHGHGHEAPLTGPMDSVVDPGTLSTSSTADVIKPGARPGRQDVANLDRAVAGIVEADGSARVTIDRGSNTATFVTGEFGVVVRPGVGGSGPDKLARTFLSQHGGLFGIADQHAELKLVNVEKDEVGFRHYKYQQLHQGLPVFGQQLVVHSKGDSVTAVGGRLTPNIGIAEPRLDAAAAAQRALAATRKNLVADSTPAGELRAVGAQELGWYTLQDGTPRLAYEVVVGAREDQRWQMYIDAKSGETLDKWSLVHSALSRETVDAKSGKVRKEGDAPTGDEVLDVAHDNAEGVYDFYHSKFGRDSIDDRGMKLKSVVHYGNKYNNAFWNGSHMTYGDGDGVRFIPFGLAADVVGHEMTHGVTERTAGLRYQRQSGAINESWSDVFGNLIEKWMDAEAGKGERDPNWLIGEEIFTPGVEGDALRSMSKPGSGYDKDPQPGHMKDYKDTSSDNGGVHINSGIPNKAAYEVAMAIGQEKLSDVWYRALTKYMTSSTQFADAANFTVQSAVDLYGSGSAEAKAVADAWTSVGLTPSLKPGVNA